MLRAIAADASFWDPKIRGSKLKSPLELVASGTQAAQVVVEWALAACFCHQPALGVELQYRLVAQRQGVLAIGTR